MAKKEKNRTLDFFGFSHFCFFHGCLGVRWNRRRTDGYRRYGDRKGDSGK